MLGTWHNKGRGNGDDDDDVDDDDDDAQGPTPFRIRTVGLLRYKETRSPVSNVINRFRSIACTRSRPIYSAST